MTVLVHPDEPLKRKLTEKQLQLLKRIVATNGGGVLIYGPNLRTADALVKRHLIQGKRGQENCAVHTRQGLEYIRSMGKEAMK